MSEKKGGRQKRRGWTTYSIRLALSKSITEFVEKQSDQSITNPSQFLDLAAREKLARHGGKKARC
ncbi:MAG: hypothetical protein J4F28_08955 [Nitrosopumilaceae archaeon]|nr:hypothetical protein [Nitrosopumilaceae archaeon]